MKFIISLLGTFFASMSLFAADFYVDALYAGAATGASNAPFTSLRAAVDAANLLVNEESSIFIRGGEDRTYVIQGSNDLSTVTVSNLTITAWEGYEKPLFDVDANLSVAAPNPEVISIAVGSDFCTITDLDFKYYNTTDKNANTASATGKSLGGSGSIISVYANNVYIKNCSFVQTGNGGNSDWGSYAGCIKSQAQESNRSIGKNLVVKDCFFKHNYQQGNGAVRLGVGGRIIGCVFEDCKSLFVTVKQGDDMHFVSNRVINSQAPIVTIKDGWHSMQNAVVAFNIFVGNSYFLEKGVDGMSEVPKIYNNTFVGGKDFIRVYRNNNNGRVGWTPQIFNNLIVCTNADAVVIKEDQDLFQDGKTTSFVDFYKNQNNQNVLVASPIFRNNAYYASALNGGAAQNVEGYEFVLPQEDNIVLGQIPTFVSLDVNSADFCRPKESKNPAFAKKKLSWTDDGEYPNYIGAMEPIWSTGFSIRVQ